jgi:hypothetical protein
MKDLLNDARDEIISLRRENEILRAKVDTMELLAGFLHAQLPVRNIGMTEDVAWKLQKEIDKINAKEASDVK